MVDVLELPSLRRRVQDQIDGELTHQRAALAGLGADGEPLVQAIESLLRGGKRLRAAFCYWGYRAAGGEYEAESVRAATAMEFFQAAALLHDDVMDNSDIRRGRPTAHRALAELHRSQQWSGQSDRFGTAGAILAGDLCLAWTDEVFASSGLPDGQLARARPVFNLMRSQLMAGQFLDVLVSARGWDGLDLDARVAQARHVIRYKSAKYSIEQPLLIGAGAAGIDAKDLDSLSGYGLALGEAFQLRDDLLGVFGDPEETGKPAGDDLREGKRTLLLAYALDGADLKQRQILQDGLGRGDLTGEQVEVMRSVILATRAHDRIEKLIDQLAAQARACLRQTRGITAVGHRALEQLVDIATARQA